MLRKVSSTTLWVAIFLVIVAVQAFSTFAQSSEVIGSWRNGSASTIQYQNRTTGAIKPGSGSSITYKFNPNGTYEFIGYLESTMYNCTNTAFNHVTGRYTVNGSTINLNPSKDLWRSGNSCFASGNKQQNRVPAKKSVEFELRDDDRGRRLICLNDGKGETCYRKEE